jgi:ribosome-associated translation inhibitor RaiA
MITAFSAPGKGWLQFKVEPQSAEQLPFKVVSTFRFCCRNSSGHSQVAARRVRAHGFQWSKRRDIITSMAVGMNHTIYFAASAFLLLLALLFLFSDQLSRLSAARSTLESEKTTDRSALEKAILTNCHAVGPFPDPVKIRVSANYQAVDCSIDYAINKVTRRLRRMQRRLKDRVHPSFNVKIVSRHRSTANLVTQIHSWLGGEFGLAYKTNGRPWKQNLINRRRFKKQLATHRLAAAGFKPHWQN